MIKSTKFDSIGHFSDLFSDFSREISLLKEFLPSNFIENKDDLFRKRISETLTLREVTHKCIINSMRTIELSSKQTENMQLFEKDDNCIFIVTGQQPGIFGGPLYNYYKAFSAISLSQRYKVLYPEFNFIPLFWVEDNDDDIDEISNITVWDKEYSLNQFKTAGYNKIKISEQHVNDSFHDIATKISEMLNIDENVELQKLLSDICNTNITLSESFIKAINYFTNNFGLIFIKSSELTATKIFNELIHKEISQPGTSKKMIDDVTNKLVECGYKQQAQPSLINLFYETDGLRKKIDYTDGNFVVDGITFSKYEMHQLADKSPERFLPKVLLRPIFQDFALPTAVYIGGPGEIAYLCQLKDMYDYFGITMPVVAGRHSITLLNNFAIRNLEKSGLNAEYFFQHFSIIEKELSVKLFNNELESAFFESENLITSGYNSLKEILNSIDKTLETNLSISLNKSLEQLLNLKKKTISQLKRKNDSEIIRLRKLSNFLFPNNIPQERVMSIFNFLAQYKSNTIIETIQDITNLTNNLHYIADLDKEFTI